MWRVTLCFLLALELEAQQWKVVGYLHTPTSFLPPPAIQFEYLTHICHAFAYPGPQGRLLTGPGVPDPALISAAHAAGDKVLISLGGAGSSGNFPATVSDSITRRSFISQVVEFIGEQGYDGADIDWEGPENEAQMLALNTFIRELRTALKDRNPAWLLTMAVGSLEWSGRWMDYETLRQYVDWFNLMAYEFHGSWSEHSGHLAPLSEPPASVCDHGSVMESVAYHVVERGTPANMIVVGVPFYGYRFSAQELYTPAAAAERIPYRAVAQEISAPARVWDPVSQVPYLVLRNQNVISYDDSISLALKCRYVKENGLAGIMIWALGQDALPGNKQPLMETVGGEMNSATPVERSPERRPELKLQGPYPNPISVDQVLAGRNPAVTFTLPDRGHARIGIYNIIGQHIATVLDEGRDGGVDYSVLLELPDDLPTGLYLVRFEFEGKVITRKMILLR